jgi:hypothetical protein
MNRVRFIAFLAVLVVAGWAIGEFAVRALDEAPASGIKVGSRLAITDEVVFDSGGRAAPLERHVNLDGAAILIVFRPGCGSCLAEALIWNDLAVEVDEMSITVLADTPDAEFVTEFSRAPHARFEILRCDDSLLRSLQPAALPVVIALHGGRIAFVSSGSGSTDELRAWLLSTRGKEG